MQQVADARRQARTGFEDAISREYRGLVQRSPLRAFSPAPATTELTEEELHTFFVYFDLTNEQVFLRQTGRITDRTWEQWSDGIRANLERPLFRVAWARLREEVGVVDELGALIAANFAADPKHELDAVQTIGFQTAFNESD